MQVDGKKISSNAIRTDAEAKEIEQRLQRAILRVRSMQAFLSQKDVCYTQMLQALSREV